MWQRVARTSRGLGAVWVSGGCMWLHVTDNVEVTTVKDEIQEWTGVFHNHSSIYTIQKRLYKDDIYTEYKNVCTKTTSTLQRRHVQHLRGSVTYISTYLESYVFRQYKKNILSALCKVFGKNNLGFQLSANMSSSD